MAEKDIAEKTLEAYNDVFADIINVLLYMDWRIRRILIMTCRSGYSLMMERLTGRRSWPIRR